MGQNRPVNGYQWLDLAKDSDTARLFYASYVPMEVWQDIS